MSRSFEIRSSMLGEVPPARCSVVGLAGKHCPGEAKYQVGIDGDLVLLCEECFLSWEAGSWRRHTACSTCSTPGPKGGGQLEKDTSKPCTTLPNLHGKCAREPFRNGQWPANRDHDVRVLSFQKEKK